MIPQLRHLLSSAGREPLFLVCATATCPTFQFFRHRTTAPFFELKFSRHRISSTAAPRHLILAPLRHIIGEKICGIKKSDI